jgi:predicted XRE-type DNA-binding protein
VNDVHLRLRTELIDALREVIRQRDLRQREAAVLFGVAQPRVSDLMRGKVALFSLDTLVGMLAAVGVTVEVQLRARGPIGTRSRLDPRRRRPTRNAPTRNDPTDNAPSS